MSIDLARYIERAAASRGGFPIPLIATDIRVRISGGLAVVETTRRFRNDEPRTIEATTTFPVPVHATLFDLSAEIDGRRIRATAQRRGVARESYEDALDRGRTAVLHEELLRGVHMLSVGQVAPGGEVMVIAVWALPLAVADGAALSLRIPTTCGDVYGRSPLPSSDDLQNDLFVLHEATLDASCDSGSVELVGGGLLDGRARVRLDHPIDILINGATLRPLQGVSADGRCVMLSVQPLAAGEQNVDATILVDRSGSMDELAAWSGANPPSERSTQTKHDVVKRGLVAASAGLRGSDRLRLWQFDDTRELVGEAPGDRFGRVLARLGRPAGGTETGAAIAAVLADAVTRDVLLITDGKSHALDVQAAARSGRRFNVVLVGEDALEAHVGYLAALTGGEIILVTDDGETALSRAFRALRRAHVAPPPITGAPVVAEARLGGMLVRAMWAPPGPAGESPADVNDRFGRAAAAAAAAMAIPRMSEQEATALAEAEGIVCHLTSLVMVDEEGEAQQGIPAQRKIPAMAPRTGMPYAVMECPPLFAPRLSTGVFDAAFACESSLDDLVFAFPTSPDAGATPGLRDLARGVDWSHDPERLRTGDLSGLPEEVKAALERVAAQCLEVISLAGSLGKPPIVVALALLALSVPRNRNAARVARAILAKANGEALAAARAAVGL